MKVKYTELVKFISLQEQIKDLQKQAKEISGRIKAEFGDHGGETEVGGILISCKQVMVTRLDEKALAKDIGPERLAKYQHEDSQMRLTVKPKADAIKTRNLKKA